MKQWTLYALRLQHGKWYVGITSGSAEQRYEEHRSGLAGSEWTKRYKPVAIHLAKTIGECQVARAQYYEGRVMHRYMEKYGEGNVRGGDLTDIVETERKGFGAAVRERLELIIIAVLTILLLITNLT